MRVRKDVRAYDPKHYSMHVLCPWNNYLLFFALSLMLQFHPDQKQISVFFYKTTDSVYRYKMICLLVSVAFEIRVWRIILYENVSVLLEIF